MSFKPDQSEGGLESPEAKASEELLYLGIQPIPENIQTVLELQKTMQQPAGFGEIVENMDSPEKLAPAMKEKHIKRVIHSEGPTLWAHCKAAARLADFMPVSDEKKADLKLIMLYHDLGKATPGMSNRPINRQILQKELGKGKLFQPAFGHAGEKMQDIEAGFKANGISGHKLDVFMTVVKNHMETSLSEMPSPKLVELFKKFGKNDDEKKEVVELLALVIQLDGNSAIHSQLTEEGEAVIELKDNRTGLNFDEIWKRYLEAKKGAGVD
jgi:hypothetical protein